MFSTQIVSIRTPIIYEPKEIDASDRTQADVDLCLSFIPSLNGLEVLKLIHSQLTNFPDLSSCRNLRVLEVDNNLLTNIPDYLISLTRLQTLGLSMNRLTSFPTHIPTTLQRLELSNNQLIKLPYNILFMQNLRWLELNCNQLIFLPKSICRLPLLQLLWIDNNPLSKPGKNIRVNDEPPTLLEIAARNVLLMYENQKNL